MPRDRSRLWRSLGRPFARTQDPMFVLDRRQVGRRQRLQPVAQERRRAERRRPASAGFGDVHNFLREGIQLQGGLSFAGGLRLDGHVKGGSVRGGVLIIGESGHVTADIEVELLQVRGEVQGNIAARQRVELRGSSRVEGTIQTPCLMIWQGAVFTGPLLWLGASALPSIPGGKPRHDLDELQAAVEAGQKECERLQRDCEQLRAALDRLQASNEQSQRERQELAQWLTALTDEAASRLGRRPAA
jgi:cytoskeletal protein CcmA (bactofilin family)